MQDEVNQVIIIGCGIAGLAASRTLNLHHIQHIILESRNRIGGRIYSEKLDGVALEMGAMIVHHPFQNNPVKDLMDQIGWKYYNKRYDSKQIMIGPDREIDEETKARGYSLYNQILEMVSKRGNLSSFDVSFEEIMEPLIGEMMRVQRMEVVNVVKTLLRIHGNIDGIDLSQLSARDLYYDDPSDVIPQGGYAMLLQTIFQFHSPTVHFNQKVSSINYSGNVIEVKTEERMYYGRKVISSLPLGILKRKMVQFKPNLPAKHRQAIDSIGVGIFNKIQVSFTTPFWDASKQYILLMSEKEKYYRMRCIVEKDKYILCAFVSASDNMDLCKLTDKQVVDDFIQCLRKYYTKGEMNVKEYHVTRWHEDQHSFGSYSAYLVGKNTYESILEIRKPIQNKLWFIGQHCDPNMNATAHGAFNSGNEAAKQAAKLMEIQSSAI